MVLPFCAIRDRQLAYDASCIFCTVVLRPEAMSSCHVRSMLVYYCQVDGGVLETLNRANITSQAPGTRRSTRPCRSTATMIMTAAMLLAFFGLDQLIRFDPANGRTQPGILRHQECVQSPLLSVEVNASSYDFGCEEIEASKGVWKLVYC